MSVFRGLFVQLLIAVVTRQLSQCCVAASMFVCVGLGCSLLTILRVVKMVGFRDVGYGTAHEMHDKIV
eukprot:m.239296 g.239296  ORF g.239296 m.239296 type:complete len:68 (+) comp17432_c1_seq28:2583-2786(+)